MDGVVSAPTSSSMALQMPKGRAKACTNCRQVKLKCNARETWPQPCLRCKSQGAECRMDSSFRRVPARRQLEEVSQKLNNLQRLLHSSQSTHDSYRLLSNSLTAQHTPDGEAVDKETEASDQERGTQEQMHLSGSLQSGSTRSEFRSPHRFYQLEEENASLKWTLGGVTVTYDVARDLFKHFADHKWRHLPILQPCKSLQALYSMSDLLFWTVILQAARNHPNYSSYFPDLLPHHRLLLGAGLLGQLSIATLHSILLVCTWPYPTPRQTQDEISAKFLRNRDPSWALLGAATNLATMMGLHKPGHQEDFEYESRDSEQSECGDAYIRNSTWLYTFYLATSGSSWLGIPPPLSSASHLDTIAMLCKDESIPESTRAKADIQRRVVQFTIQLDTMLDLRTRYSLVNVFEQYLDRAKDTFNSVWTQDLEVDILGAKIYLYGIALVNSPNRLGYVPVEDPGIMARNILQRGLTAAVRLCHTVCNMNFDNVTMTENHPGRLSNYSYQLSWYPKRFNLAVAFATIFLAWFLAVDNQAIASDKQLARKYINDVRQMYSNFHHSQEHLNLGKKLENLTTLPVTAPKLTVSSRLGASFMYSYNFMYRYLKSAEANAKFSMANAPNAVRVSGVKQIDQQSSDQVNRRCVDTAFNPSSGSNAWNSGSSLPESWEISWSEWDPAVFEELQALTWGQSVWDMDTLLAPEP